MILKPVKRFAVNIACHVSHCIYRSQFDALRTHSGPYTLEGFDRLHCIYVHIPKTAGVSINKALFGNYGGGHRSVRSYRRIFGPRVFNQYFKFTFVRNPYSRLLSAYQFFRNGGFNESDQLWASENLSQFASFEAFVMDWLNEHSIWSKDHFVPQYAFVSDVDSNLEVDFVGKFESIDDDFREVCHRLGVTATLGTENSGGTGTASWRDHYSNMMLDKVSRIYAKDFAVFSYRPECA